MFMSVVTVHIRKCLIVRSHDVFVIVCCDREYQEVSDCAFIGDVSDCLLSVSDCVYTIHVSNFLL